jgi:hypothetical protein
LVLNSVPSHMAPGPLHPVARYTQTQRLAQNLLVIRRTTQPLIMPKRHITIGNSYLYAQNVAWCRPCLLYAHIV